MSKKTLQTRKKAYKFIRNNGEWSIVIAQSKDSARSEYKEFYNISDSIYKKENIKSLTIKNKKQKIKNMFFDKKIPLEVVINHIKFPPRVVCDNQD